MKNIFKKLDLHTLSVERPKIVPRPSEVEKETTTYTLKFLKNQKEAITKQRDALIAEKERELAEVEGLIIEAEKLGIIEKVEETAGIK